MSPKSKFRGMLAIYACWLAMLGTLGYLSGIRPTLKAAPPAQAPAQP